jgi:uncharacterized membrane protein (UPF0127 family)
VRRAATIALLALASVHCASRAPEARPAARVVIETRAGARHAVAVEVVRTDAERQRGLMDRRELAPEAGMLFLFEETAEHPFWMKNTLLPLDMLFLGEDGRVNGIVERAVPGDLTPRTAGGPSRYVLEVNGGWAAAHGVAPGDRARFEHVGMY